MNDNHEQGELVGLIWRPFQKKSRLRVNDVIWVDGKLGRVVRVNDCAAVVLINQSKREFKTRFDKQVSFQPKPTTFRISVNSEAEILNRKSNGKSHHRKRKEIT